MAPQRLKRHTSDEFTSTRGLEQRLSEERQKRKFIAIHTVLKAQQRYAGNPSSVANVAAKVSRWASEVAKNEARNDFTKVYRPDLITNEMELDVDTDASVFSFPPVIKNSKRWIEEDVAADASTKRSRSM